MFDFEKLQVYQKAKEFNLLVNGYIKNKKLDPNTRNQLKRAAFSIMLNIAEGSGRYSNKDKRNFYIIARGSAFETVAIFDYLHDDLKIETETFKSFYSALDELSRMLFRLIKSLSKQPGATASSSSKGQGHQH